MTKEKFLSFKPCSGGVRYVDDFSSVREAWDDCASVSDMLWLAGNFPACRANIVLFAEECACIALAHAATKVNYSMSDAYAAARAASNAASNASSYSASGYAAYAADYAAINNGIERNFQIKRIKELFTDLIFKD